MTARLTWSDSGAVRWLIGLVTVCAAMGIAAGIKPQYGIAAALALAFTVSVFANLTAGLAVFTTLSFLEILQFGGGAVTFMKLAGLLLFLSWLASASSSSIRSATANLVSLYPALVIALVAFVSWSALSIAWSTQRGLAVTTSYSYLLDMLLIPIMVYAVRNQRQVQIIIAAFVLGAVVSGAYGVIHPLPTTAQDAGRLAGALGEANQQATVLVAAIVLAVSLAGVVRRSAPLMLLASLGAILAFAGLVQTLSRAGLVSFGCVLVAAVVIGGRWRRTASVLLAIAIGAVGLYYFVLAPATAAQRVTMSDTSGRTDLWRIAWRAFEAHPVVGVGSDNFQAISIRYLQRAGAITNANLVVDTPKVAHNIYLESLVDLGIPGLLTLLAVFFCAIGATLKAAHIFERIGDRQQELLSRCVVLALIGFMTADFFASELTSKQLWIVIALCPTMLKLARSAERRVASQPRWPAPASSS